MDAGADQFFRGLCCQSRKCDVLPCSCNRPSCLLSVHHTVICPLQGSWATALQIALVVGTVLLILGLVPFLYLSAHWYLFTPSDRPTDQATPAIAAKPVSSGRQAVQGEEGGAGQSGRRLCCLALLRIALQDCIVLVSSLSCKVLKGPAWLHLSAGTAARSGTLSRGWQGACDSVAKGRQWTARFWAAVDARLRQMLLDNIHMLVAWGLVIGLLLGASLLTAVFAIQIGAPRLPSLALCLGSWCMVWGFHVVQSTLIASV